MRNTKTYKDQLEKNEQKRKDLESKLKAVYVDNMFECITALTINKTVISIYEKTDSEEIKRALDDIINSRQFANLMKKTLEDQAATKKTEDYNVNITATESETNSVQYYSESVEKNDSSTINKTDDNVNMNHNYYPTDTNNY